MIPPEVLANLALNAAFSSNPPRELEKNMVCYDLQGNTWIIQRNMGHVVYAYNHNEDMQGSFMSISDLRPTHQFNHALEVLTGKLPPDIIYDVEAAFASALALTADDPFCLEVGEPVVISVNDPHIYNIESRSNDGKLNISRSEIDKFSGRQRKVYLTVNQSEIVHFQNLFHSMLLHSSADVHMASTAQEIINLLTWK